MKKENTVLSRYFEAITEIWNLIENDQDLRTRVIINRYKLNQRTATVLQSKKIIFNIGSRTKPLYDWISRKPDIEMAKELLSEVNRIQAEKMAESRRKITEN